jgi:hypothetical protein
MLRRRRHLSAVSVIVAIKDALACSRCRDLSDALSGRGATNAVDGIVKQLLLVRRLRRGSDGSGAAD